MNDEVNEDNSTFISSSSLDNRTILGRMLEESLTRLVKKNDITPEYALSIIGNT